MSMMRSIIKKNVEIVARSTYDPAIGLNAIILISFKLI